MIIATECSLRGVLSAGKLGALYLLVVTALHIVVAVMRCCSVLVLYRSQLHHSDKEQTPNQPDYLSQAGDLLAPAQPQHLQLEAYGLIPAPRLWPCLHLHQHAHCLRQLADSRRHQLQLWLVPYTQ